jgi:hypothetical protein
MCSSSSSGIKQTKKSFFLPTCPALCPDHVIMWIVCGHMQTSLKPRILTEINMCVYISYA